MSNDYVGPVIRWEDVLTRLYGTCKVRPNEASIEAVRILMGVFVRTPNEALVELGGVPFVGRGDEAVAPDGIPCRVHEARLQEELDRMRRALAQAEKSTRA